MRTSGPLLPVLLVAGSLVLALTDAKSIRSADRPEVTDKCDSEIYCDGPLLQTVQLAEIYNDSKTFVDLSQKNSPNVTMQNFKKLMRNTNNKPTREQVRQFVEQNFLMEDELMNVTLPDWNSDPLILKNIQDSQFRQFARQLNEIWKTLARKMKDSVAQNPDRHSLIYANNTFIIPGGRFKEFYYWDSYWIMRGLLLCDMRQTVKGMVENFAHMVNTYGFIPNGDRVYYLMRSQPPLFIQMVKLYVDTTGDRDFLKAMMPVMEKEFDYWQTQKTVTVNKNGKTYTMVHYVTDSPSPRPESYREDYLMAQQLPNERRGTFYKDIKAAAESGWDFSNRWCIGDDKNGTISLLNISTSNIIPVDLTSIVQKNAVTLSQFHASLGNTQKSLFYAKIAAGYQAAIDNVLWNENEGTWCDYDMKNNKSICAFYPSNLTPLYTNSYDRLKAGTIAYRTINYLKRNRIDLFFGGTPTSLNYTGEQWDFPNAWPPLQSIMILGLQNLNQTKTSALAKLLAGRWIRSNYVGFDEYGAMFEKYNAIHPGEGGGGGEYTVQEGFGWTNGVIFELLNLYPDLQSSESYDMSNEMQYNNTDSQESVDNYDYARLRRSIRQSWEE